MRRICWSPLHAHVRRWLLDRVHDTITGMTLTHRTKNPWHIDGNILVLQNRPNGVEIFAKAMDRVLNHTWCIAYFPNGKVRCVRTTIPHPFGGRRADGAAKQLELKLHRLIMEDVPHRPEQKEIDHIDGNPLNNRPDNLRWVTRSVNAQNRRDVNGMPTRGVDHRADHYRTRPWSAKICVDGERVEENFSTAREAEEQYLIWKRKYHTETPEIWFEQYAECQAKGYWD